jgi:hypothetical protein
MELASLWVALRARATSDTGAGGLFQTGSAMLTGMYNTQAPTSASGNYAVYSVASAVSEDAFSLDLTPVTFRVAVYVPKKPSDSSDPMLKLSNIVSRLHARYHRWTPTLSGSMSWTSTAIQFAQVIENHEEDVYSMVAEFKLHVSKAA